MVSAQFGMDFSQELPPFLFRDASLEHSGHTFLVEFPFVDLVSLRTPECSKDASPKRKGGKSWLKSMPDWAGTTPRLEH